MKKRIVFLLIVLLVNGLPCFSQQDTSMLDNNILTNFISNYDAIMNSMNGIQYRNDMQNIKQTGDKLNVLFYKIYNGNFNSEEELKECLFEFMELIRINVSVGINNIFSKNGVGNNGVSKLLYIMFVTRLIHYGNNLMIEFMDSETKTREIFFGYQMRLYCISSFLDSIDKNDYELLKDNNKILFNLLSNK
jgi:hypothetical protein